MKLKNLPKNSRRQEDRAGKERLWKTAENEKAELEPRRAPGGRTRR